MRPATVLAGLLALAVPAAAEPWPERVRISTTNFDPYHRPDGSGFEDRLLREMFGRLGVAVDIVALAGERALVNADLGLDDGTAARVVGIERAYSNLVRVPERAYTVEFTVFTRRPDIVVRTWADLEPYSVAFINGWKILENNVTRARMLTKVNGLENLFALLRLDRTDVVITIRWIGLREAEKQGIEDVRALQPAIAERDTYILLNARHAALAQAVGEALRAMKRDGTYARIHAETLAPLER